MTKLKIEEAEELVIAAKWLCKTNKTPEKYKDMLIVIDDNGNAYLELFISEGSHSFSLAKRNEEYNEELEESIK